MDEEFERSVRNGFLKIKGNVTALADGCHFWKVRSANKWFNRRFWLDTDHLLLRYGPSCKPFYSSSQAKISLADIVDIRPWKPNFFDFVSRNASSKRTKDLDERKCLSIVCHNQELNLLAPDDKTATDWMTWLMEVIRIVRGAHHEHEYELWLTEMFRKADKDRSGTLDFNECLNLLYHMNVQLSHSHAKQLFESANTEKTKHGAQVLNSQEFIAFTRLLIKRTELEDLFHKYSQLNGAVFTAKELIHFLNVEQRIKIDQAKADELIQKFEKSRAKIDGYLTFVGFTAFMNSGMFHIMNPDHTKVYQDMTQPLAHYYIASSHNTYLTGNQLTSKSSVDAYVSCLEQGCRCLELDLWDGPDGEPIIKHGYTMTSAISVKDVLKVVKEHAFSKSPYPVILSLENHLTANQQEKLVQLLKSILGDILYTTPVSDDMKNLPSPEQLKNKIIIKASIDTVAQRYSISKKTKKSLVRQKAVVEDTLDYGIAAVLAVRPPLIHSESTTTDGSMEVISTSVERRGSRNQSNGRTATDMSGFNGKAAHLHLVNEARTKVCPSADTIDESFHFPEGAVEKSLETHVHGQQEKAQYTSALSDEPEPIVPISAQDEPVTESNTLSTQSKEIKDLSMLQVQSIPSSLSVGSSNEEPGPISSEDSGLKQSNDLVNLAERKPLTQAPSFDVEEQDAIGELTRLVNLCTAVRFQRFHQQTPTARCYHISSLSETKAKEMIDQSSDDFIEHTRHQLLRIYPKGTRTGSSNYEPLTYWNVGCQIVALNYQTIDRPMKLNVGKFLQNGNCGFLLKPSFLINDSIQPDPDRVRQVVTIRVISGQNLPKVPQEESDIVDPYVTLKVYGHPQDQFKYKTKSVSNNGLNPVWNETAKMEIRMPELDLLLITVKDEDTITANDFIGWYCLPLTSLAKGYRHVPLFNEDGKIIPMASVFVHVSVRKIDSQKSS